MKNADNENLSAYEIGCVDNINGEGAAESPDFIPTRHELFAIAKHWAQILIKFDWLYFLDRQCGGEWYWIAFDNRRLNRIAKILGETEFQKAIDEATDEFGRLCDPRWWEIFRHGTEEQWEQVPDEFFAELAKERKIASETEQTTSD